MQISPAHDRDLIQQLYVGAWHRSGEFGKLLLGQVVIAVAGTDNLIDGNALQISGQIFQQARIVRKLFVNFPDRIHNAPGVVVGQQAQDANNMIAINRPQHHRGGLRFDLAAAIGDRLIQQTKRIAHAAIGSARKHRECCRIILNAFSFADMLEAIGNHSRRHALEIELQTTRQDCSRQLMRVRGCKQKLDVCRGLFERLQKRVERAPGQHVYFVDQVNLVTTACGCVLDVVEQITGIVDFCLRCGIDLDQVNETSLIDFFASTAFAAGFGCNPGLTVECFGEYASDGRFANTTRTRKQIGMMQPAGFKGIYQCPQHMLLADGFREVFGPPFASQDKVTHRLVHLEIIVQCNASGPRQLLPGTRCHRYRCSLPGLAEFAADRREDADADRRRLSPLCRRDTILFVDQVKFSVQFVRF